MPASGGLPRPVIGSDDRLEIVLGLVRVLLHDGSGDGGGK